MDEHGVAMALYDGTKRDEVLRRARNQFSWGPLFVPLASLNELQYNHEIGNDQTLFLLASSIPWENTILIELLTLGGIRPLSMYD